jgi:hypothetical protein
MIDARLEESHLFVRVAFKHGTRGEGKFLSDRGHQVIHIVEFSTAEFLLQMSEKKEI